ncbi:hypothetical protein [Rhizobium sp. C4]|uniref:hypothetical protein n=1 Tax=Rhizobium sp. C4 TaxID=1349800 RepID=UPI001E36F98F|nr:hypothetical protein [Rhizobium sp. C4]MCD2174181.1 hypothetical protein [Rhizobium sp. C4]
MVATRSISKSKALREATSDLTADISRLREAYFEGKASGDGDVVRPEEFLKALKAERDSRG